MVRIFAKPAAPPQFDHLDGAAQTLHSQLQDHVLGGYHKSGDTPYSKVSVTVTRNTLVPE